VSGSDQRLSDRRALREWEARELTWTSPVSDEPADVSILAGLIDELPSFYVGCLTERQAEVLAMRYHQQLPYSEIGELLGISKHAAWRLHKRACASLKRHYHDLHDEHTPEG
jgi:RNA polymerase sigma factor (sigma-70 family)